MTKVVFSIAIVFGALKGAQILIGSDTMIILVCSALIYLLNEIRKSFANIENQCTDDNDDKNLSKTPRFKNPPPPPPPRKSDDNNCTGK